MKKVEVSQKSAADVLVEASDDLILDHPPATHLICECGKDYPHIHLVRHNDDMDQGHSQ